MKHVTEEIASQPDSWRRAARLASTGETTSALPAAGERIAVLGCGTSWFMAQSYAALREQAGQGVTDAYAASEFTDTLLGTRGYDRIVALTRSGTTTEVIAALTELRGRIQTTVITADPTTPVMELADRNVVLDFADEVSVVQTRFATSALTLLRSHIGLPVEQSIADAEQALAQDLPDGALGRGQFTFLGSGWTVGLANEAALKMREASISWTEAYPAMEYRHGPMSITDDSSVVWFLGAPPAGLFDQTAALGAIVVAEPDRDPLAELIRVQRLAVGIGAAKGLDPDNPRNLTRSVVLPAH